MKKIIILLSILQFLYAEYKYTNALINEDSLYLRQHAHNPVEWYPWGNEALEKAKRENKLIFLSIGYSTCHWCHVMEEESFEDEAVAALLNKNYISIKIDREELPQIDKKYQKLYFYANGKRGGWPLNVFLTPDMEPLNIAIYIPATRGYGSIGMIEMLPYFANRYEEKPEEIAKLVTAYKSAKDVNKSLDKNLTMGIVSKVLTDIEQSFDKKYGGFDTRPKFPEASKIELLLNIYKLNGNKKVLQMAEHTLKFMAEGGIYDQVEGGFFRYTTDERWHIPHFEKMLYTNAELIPQYVTMYELIKNPLYKRVVTETITHMEKYFMIDGHYLSASDADSDGVEGGYFIYSYMEIMDALIERSFSKKEAYTVLTYLGIEEDGNIDGEYSNSHVSADMVPPRLNEAKEYLLSLRKKRKYPFRDKKIITAWNAMMIKALYAASKLDSDYIGLANKRLKKLEKLMKRDSKLYHQITLGKEPKQLALLEDYAFLIDAYLEGYFRTYDKHYLKEAETLSMEAIEIFYRGKIWYLSSDGVDTVADFDDRYYTSALSMMLESLERLGSLGGDLKYHYIVRDTIASHGAILELSPALAPKLTQIFLRIEIGDVIVKSTKSNLHSIKEQLANIKHPFVLTKIEKDNIYLACKITSCFAYSDEFAKITTQIEKSKRESTENSKVKFK